MPTMSTTTTQKVTVATVKAMGRAIGATGVQEAPAWIAPAARPQDLRGGADQEAP